MKKDKVKVGGTYKAKVSGKLTEVRITGESRHGGWDAVNVLTNRTVRIKSAQRLRGEALRGKANKTAKAAPRAHTLATGATGGAEATTEAPKAKKAPRRADGHMSGLDAAAKVLEEAGTPMTTREMFACVVAKGYWTSEAPTPHNTLYSAILREITKKGDTSRFVKAERGKFALKG
ncbi:MAG: winged helix-turn-helix domain-containing protein [Planctomycetes bacterium]|nr:winged helix-turn-helix domain-containing protein [Planctomycetota bacterium]